MTPKILVITPVLHIRDIKKNLDSIGEVTYLDDPTSDEVKAIICNFDAIYTNPNKSKVFIGKEILDAANRLKVICTASTGTNHIDKVYVKKIGITLLSITEEREVINRISSTAELAFSLTLASLRHVVKSNNSVLNGDWDYEKFIGRQMNFLTIGIIGYGRLGTIYAKFCKAFDSKILVYDPYKEIIDRKITKVNYLKDILKESNVIALHVHVTDETIGMVDKACFDFMKKDVVIVNTSRGDIVNENDLVSFLQSNPKARVATDVLVNEIKDRKNSPLLKYAKKSDQVIITPHIGGMCVESQEIAYGHAAKMLSNFFKSVNT
jgi:phosphoglycerate dehydrogenase-like enzyme|tara:strand:+ start:348 stop:1313 length:966 start_codon:yes stop_codon:yes gene_type:complete